MPTTPRPFISHAHADKERFVMEFAKRLRDKGIDAWVDSWEMRPGDSLIDKIMNEGLKDCTAFIVVISKCSETSAWVKEELNAALIKRIEDKTRLIPICLDGCVPPFPLKNTLRVDVHDVNNYDKQFEEIVNTLFDQYSKPELGARPSYVNRSDILNIGGLTPIDSVIFERACRIGIEINDTVVIPAKRLVQELAAEGISEHQIVETQEVLVGQSYIELHRFLGPIQAYDFAITIHGMERFLQASLPDYAAIQLAAARILVQNEGEDNFTLAQQLELSVVITTHILELFELHRLVRLSKTMDGRVSVFQVAVELKRKVRDSRL